MPELAMVADHVDVDIMHIQDRTSHESFHNEDIDKGTNAVLNDKSKDRSSKCRSIHDSK